MDAFNTFKKATVVTLAVSSLCVTHAASAVTPAQAQSRWYVNVGLEDYSVNTPTYRLPITFGGWTASNPPTPPPTNGGLGYNSANSTAGNTTWLPSIRFGYRLGNLSRLFPGYLDDESVELAYAQFNRATKDSSSYSGATGVDAGAGYGVIWKIDDTSVPMYNFAAWRIENSYVHASVHYHDVGVFVKANVRNLPSYLRSKVRLGVVGTSLDQFYAYDINANAIGGSHLPSVYTTGDDSVRARYIGLALGDELELQIAPAFSLFADGNVQGLYAASFMTTNQIPDQLAAPNGGFADYRNNIRISNSSHTFTYRARVAGGLNFYPKLMANQSLVKISFYAGVDQWGYVPQPVTVSEFGAKSPHIEGQSMRNFFAGVNATIPIA